MNIIRLLMRSLCGGTLHWPWSACPPTRMVVWEYCPDQGSVVMHSCARRFIHKNSVGPEHGNALIAAFCGTQINSSQEECFFSFLFGVLLLCVWPVEDDVRFGKVPYVVLVCVGPEGEKKYVEDGS